MKKRIIAMLCVMAVLLTAGALDVKTNAATGRYQVGYAIKDMNPWLDYNDHSKGLNLGLFNLTGNGDDDTRPLSGLFDDNGDGVQGEGDGLYTTATAVTDPYGKTVIYITIDSLQGYSNVTTDARAAIVERLGSDVISPEQIMVSGSHTHSGGYFQGMRTATGARGEYYKYIISQITAAAVEAYNDRAEAVMTKGTINAKESTAHLGYNGGKGYHMNAIRHYEVTITNKKDTSQSMTYMVGSGDGINKSSEYPYASVSKSTVTTDVSDNNMHILKFDFPNNSSKEPIVFVNWRAHTTMNSGVNKKLLSSDYVNGLRTKLKSEGYRAAFFQGAAGNVVTCAKEAAWKTNAADQDWRAYATDSNTKTYIYGTMLAEIAMDCMERKMGGEIKAGKIRNVQKIWHGVKQPDSDGLRAAAANAKQIANDGGTVEFPYRYMYTDGIEYVVNSQFHCNNINSRASATDSYTNLEINAIMLGDAVAFVTAPNELADYYNIGSLAEEENDWFDLISESYGTPFVLGYTNSGNGYIANWMDHLYNTPEYYEVTGYGKDGDKFFSPGTYESITSRFAQGQGEALMIEYRGLLDHLQEGERMAYCEACAKTVEWKPIMGYYNSSIDLPGGHYYLYEDMPYGAVGNNRIRVLDGNVLCLDLNGHKIETPSRSIYMEGAGSTMNLYDSVGGGALISYTGGNNVGGGAVSMSAGTTLNIYGGTIQFIRKPLAGKKDTGNGAVVAVNGKAVLNMYGGKLIGGELVMSDYYNSASTSNGCGATIYAYDGAKINVSGGEIIAGRAPDESAGDCIYLAGSKCRVTVSGNAKIDEIYMKTHTSAQINISGTFKGKLGVRTAKELAIGSSLVTLSSAKITGASLTYTAKPEYELRTSGSYLKLYQRTSGAAVVYENYQATGYSTLQAALSACDKGLITLLADNTETVVISKDTSIDLNGFSLNGKVTVAEGATLYGMDSETDDFTIEDDQYYGKITDATGNICGTPEESAHTKDTYLMVTDDEGYSFHRVQLQLTAMSFRPDAMGLYYKSTFAGDEVVAENIDRYGVALSVTDEPNTENFSTQCKASWFTGFQSGATGNTSSSTLLKGIMKPTNDQGRNEANGTMPIYGRAYALTKDGQYLFGHSANRTLKRQMEDVSDIRSTLTAEQKKAAVDACYQYIDIVRNWDVADLLAENATNDGSLKILAIGNSYAVDSMHLLHEVYAAENPDKKVVLGYAYNSGCTLAEHVQYTTDNSAAYTYYEVAEDGTRKITALKTLMEIVGDDNWDVVVLQQGSSESGLADTYNGDMKKLRTFVSTNLGYTPKFGWNMTWSYPVRTTENAEGFDNYGSQEAMFAAIVSAVKSKILTDTSYTYMMPVGLAIQNTRTYYTNRSDIHRDAYGHLNDMSRLMAAYVWYCELEGVTLDSLKLTTIPENLTKSWADAGNAGDMILTETQIKIILEAVNNALAARKDGTLATVDSVYN